MKILFANSMKGLGGGERWLLDVSSGLRERGHRTWVAARTASALAAAARASGAGVLELPMRADLDPESLAGLVAFYARERPDLVISQIQRAHRLCVVASWMGPRVPQALRVGQLRPVDNKWLNAIVWRPLRLVVANCMAIEGMIAGSGLVERRALKLLYNGVPRAQLPPRMEARQALGLLPEDEVVVCVARLARLKGHRALLEAWTRVRELRPGARLILAGGGGAERALRAVAARRGLDGSVTFLGDRRDVGMVWAAADLSVLPSEEEGLPYSVLESMAAGVPAIGTRVAGIPELLEHERTGLLVPAREPGALAREIVRVLSDREWGARLAARARERVDSRFSLRAMLDRCEAIFEAAAAGGY